MFIFNKSFAHERHEKGGGSSGRQTVVQQVQAPTPAPPTKGEAAQVIGASSIAMANRKTGRSSTQMGARGTFEDQLKALLGQ